MRLELNRPKGHNRYCGPAVISILTGMTTNAAADKIRWRSGRIVRGVYIHDLVAALKDCGWRYREWKSCPVKPTLAQWLKDTKARRTSGRIYLVLAGSHYQIITGRRYICGRVGELVSVRDKRVKRRARVSQWLELVRA
jgi:hypothetical protein